MSNLTSDHTCELAHGAPDVGHLLVRHSPPEQAHDGLALPERDTLALHVVRRAALVISAADVDKVTMPPTESCGQKAYKKPK